jgi:hypothetical protein
MQTRIIKVDDRAALPSAVCVSTVARSCRPATTLVDFPRQGANLSDRRWTSRVARGRTRTAALPQKAKLVCEAAA